LENTPLLFPSDFFVRRAMMVSRAPGLDKDTPDDTHLQYFVAFQDESWRSEGQVPRVIFGLVFFNGMSEILGTENHFVSTFDIPNLIIPLFRTTRAASVLLFVIAFPSFNQCLAQQTNEFAAVDTYALSIPKSEASSVDRLAAALAKGARNDREKARAIYRWITKNILYDTHAFFSGNLGDMSANNVLKTMKGVCDGYAQLFAALAQSMGLGAERVVGNSKGYGYVVGSRIEGPANHAWNAVKIYGSWQLVDCTWGAGYIDANKKFVERFNEYYFLPPADQFVYDHFPDNPDKQFLSPPVSKNFYENLVDVQPLFFLYGLKLVSHREGIIRANERLDVVLDAPRDVSLLVQLLRNDQAQDPSLTYVYRNKEDATLTAVFPETGQYILRLFVKRRGDSNRQFEKALDYQVNVKIPMSKSVSFPMLFQAFDDYGIVLRSNAEREMQVDRNVSIELVSASDFDMLASLQMNGTKLEEGYTFVQSTNGDHIIRAIFPRPGKYSLTVYAKRKSESGNYNAVLTYGFNSVAPKDPNAYFPVVYEQYREWNARLFSPLEGHLEAGKAHSFKIMVPGAETVAIVCNGQWTPLKKNGDMFEGGAIIGAARAEVFARFAPGKQFIGLLRYEGIH
jgi:transglutaminase/protease-like cytokinesis protein 3